MNPIDGVFNRRNLLRGGWHWAASAFFVRGAYAEELARTPSLTEGPFYPPKLPLDTDNDLLVINDDITPAVGEVTHLSGRVLSRAASRCGTSSSKSGSATPRAFTSPRRTAKGRDSNFQGFGRFLTSSTGEYYFRTIKPVPYPGRTPHIHVKIKKGGSRAAHHAVLHQRPSAESHRRNLSGRGRAAGAGTSARRFQADQGLEDRRAGGPHGRRARPHAGRSAARRTASPPRSTVNFASPSLSLHRSLSELSQCDQLRIVTGPDCPPITLKETPHAPCLEVFARRRCVGLAAVVALAQPPDEPRDGGPKPSPGAAPDEAVPIKRRSTRWSRG